ncbi:hypothetical protein IKE79_00005, partial [Candidatus Saccharibacteria bacterium]|nr:hypothetical protein [Candidatus Saccharibacteria bacterium]
TSAVCKNELTPVVVTREEVNNETVTNFTASPNSFIALEDERDGNVYAVARLGMGWDSTNNTYEDTACWMIENLRLDNTAELTIHNTNNPTTSFALTASTDNWCTEDTQGCDDQPLINTNNITNPVSPSNYSASGNIYSYGTYYNWYSATAGGGTYSNSTNAEHITSSICPTNWILPQGGATATNGGQTINTESSDFYKLGKAITGAEPESINSWNQYYYAGQSNAFRDYPNNFILSGYWNYDSASVLGTYGLYWSSSAYSAAHSYYLNLDSANVYPGTNGSNKFRGFSVRCLAGN